MELLSTSQVHRAGKGQHKQASLIPPEGLQAMVGSLFSPQPITFTQNDLPDIRYPHTRPLYVEVLVDHVQIKRVLIDTGAGLKICTLSTARLGSGIWTLPGFLLTTAVRAYDGTTRTAQGIVRLQPEWREATTTTMENSEAMTVERTP